jgi:hypothetical protein
MAGLDPAVRSALRLDKVTPQEHPQEREAVGKNIQRQRTQMLRAVATLAAPSRIHKQARISPQRHRGTEQKTNIPAVLNIDVLVMLITLTAMTPLGHSRNAGAATDGRVKPAHDAGGDSRYVCVSTWHRRYQALRAVPVLSPRDVHQSLLRVLRASAVNILSSLHKRIDKLRDPSLDRCQGAAALHCDPPPRR